MLNVSKETKGSTLIVKLTGSIEESANLHHLIGTTPKDVILNLKDVPRINSVGVKTWIKYFQELKASGVIFRFTECSTSIVEQLNLISNFSCGGKVDSIYVPFCCQSCNHEMVGLFYTDDLKKLNFKIPDTKCPKCSGKAIFDDLPEEYFGFIVRNK